MAYQDATTRRLYVSESPLLADDTSYQFVSSDVDDDTETARVNAMQAAYDELRLRDADAAGDGGGGQEDDLEAEARYQEALRERLGKPPPPPKRWPQQQRNPPPPPAGSSSVAADAARRYGVPKLDLRDSVDESRNYDEYAAVEDSLDFETPRAAAGGAVAAAAAAGAWSDPPPNPFALPAAIPPNAENLAKPTPAVRSTAVAAVVAGVVDLPSQAHQMTREGEVPRPLLRPVGAPPVGAVAFDYGNLQSSRAQQPLPAGQLGLLGRLAGDAERAWQYRQLPPGPPPPNLERHGPKTFAEPATDDGDLDRRPAPVTRPNRAPLEAPASTAESGAGGGSVDGIRHLPPKPQRPAPNFVELNKSRALAKDASPKGSYVERISKKKEVSEMLKDQAPGMRMPRRKAASADDVSVSAGATVAETAAGQALSHEQAEAAAAAAAAADEAQVAELWRQRASGLSAAKGPKNNRGAGSGPGAGGGPAVPPPAGALYRRSSDSNINRPPHFVQPLPLAVKDVKSGERDRAPGGVADDAGGGGAYRAAPFDSLASSVNRLQPVVGPAVSAPAAPVAYADVLFRPPPTYYQPPLLPLPHGYGGGIAGPYLSGYGPYFLGAPPPPVHPAFPLAYQDARTSAGLSAGAAAGTRQAPEAALFHGPQLQSNVGLPTEQAAPYGGAYSSLPNMDARGFAGVGRALDLPPQVWSGIDAGTAAPPPPPSLHAQLDAAGAGRLTQYATVPPIRTAPAASDGGSYSQQYTQLREKEKRRAQENPSYTAYTLSDYRKLEKEIKLGGLGPSLDPLTLREKNERRLRQLQYAKQAVEQQRVALEAKQQQHQQRSSKQQQAASGGKADEGDESERGTNTTPAQERLLFSDAPSADEALRRRHAALEYARSVPKPKVKVRPKPDDISSAVSSAASPPRDSRTPSSSASSAARPPQLSDRGEWAPAAATAALVPLSKLGDADLQMLHQRHQLEKMAVMELRKNTRAAV